MLRQHAFQKHVLKLYHLLKIYSILLSCAQPSSLHVFGLVIKLVVVKTHLVPAQALSEVYLPAIIFHHQVKHAQKQLEYAEMLFAHKKLLH